jgi:hypothetical protein
LGGDQGCAITRGKFQTFATCCAYARNDLFGQGACPANSPCNPPTAFCNSDFDMSLCSQISDDELFNYFATQTNSCCSQSEISGLNNAEKKSIACACVERCPCPFGGQNPCSGQQYSPFASPGHCENGETTDPTQPGESQG